MKEPTKRELAAGKVPNLRGERAQYGERTGTLTGRVGMGGTLQLKLDDPPTEPGPASNPNERPHYRLSIWVTFGALQPTGEPRQRTDNWCNDLVPCPSCGRTWTANSHTHAEDCSTPTWGQY